MDSREYESLIKLIETNHGEVLRELDDIKRNFIERVGICRERMNALDEKLHAHSTSLTRIKTIGTIGGSLWSAIVLILNWIFLGGGR